MPRPVGYPLELPNGRAAVVASVDPDRPEGPEDGSAQARAGAGEHLADELPAGGSVREPPQTPTGVVTCIGTNEPADPWPVGQGSAV